MCKLKKHHRFRALSQTASASSELRSLSHTIRYSPARAPATTPVASPCAYHLPRPRHSLDVCSSSGLSLARSLQYHHGQTPLSALLRAAIISLSQCGCHWPAPTHTKTNLSSTPLHHHHLLLAHTTLYTRPIVPPPPPPRSSLVSFSEFSHAFELICSRESAMKASTWLT